MAIMLILAGIWSIYELNNIGVTAQNLIKENYQSIHAANTMLNALEGEDNGILFLLLGRWEEGRRLLSSSDSLFLSGFDVAKNNLTIPGEAAVVDSIRTRYAALKAIWEKPIVETYKERNIDWYFIEVHRAFQDAKSAVQALQILNNDTMYQTATVMENRANRAIMPGIIAMTAAVVLSLLFNFFINHYVVNPILRLNRGIRNHLDDHKPLEIEVETHDEIRELSNLILTLSARSARRD